MVADIGKLVAREAAELATRVDRAAAPPAAQPGDEVGPNPYTPVVEIQRTEARLKDDIQIAVQARRLGGDAEQLADKLLATVDKVCQDLAAGKKPSPADLDLVHEQLQAFTRHIQNSGTASASGPPFPPAALARYEQQAGGEATEIKKLLDAPAGQQGKALAVIRQVSGDPAHMEALLTALKEQGVDFPALADRFGGKELEQLVTACARGMGVDEKAAAITRCTAPDAGEARRQAAALMLAGEPEQEGRAALMLALAGQESSYDRLVDGLGDDGRRARFKDVYFRPEQYRALLAQDIPLGRAALAEAHRQAASLVASENKLLQSAEAARARSHVADQADAALSKQPPPAGNAEGAARGGKALVKQLSEHIRANATRAGQLDEQLAGNQFELARVNEELSRQRSKKELLQGLLAGMEPGTRKAEELKSAVTSLEKDTAALTQARGRLLAEHDHLQAAHESVVEAGNKLHDRSIRAAEDLFAALEKGADATVAREVTGPAQKVLDEARKLAYDPKAAPAAKTEYLKKLARLTTELDAQVTRLEKLAGGEPAAPPARDNVDATDEKALAAYQADYKKSRAAAAVDGLVGPAGTPQAGELNQAGAAAVAQMAQVLADVDHDLTAQQAELAQKSLQLPIATQALMEAGAQAMNPLAAPPPTLEKTIKANSEAGRLLPRARQQLAQDQAHLGTLVKQRDEALKALKDAGVDGETVQKLRDGKLTAEERQQLGQKIRELPDAEKAVKAMKAVLVLSGGADVQIKGVQQATKSLESFVKQLEDTAAKTAPVVHELCSRFNAVLAAAGGGPIKEDFEGIKAGLADLNKRINGDRPIPGNRGLLDPGVLEALYITARSRQEMMDNVLKRTLRDGLGYGDAELTEMNISETGMRKAVAALRKETGAEAPPPQDPGALTDKESTELAQVMSGELKAPATPLVQGLYRALGNADALTEADLAMLGGDLAASGQSNLDMKGMTFSADIGDIARKIQDPNTSHDQRRRLRKLVREGPPTQEGAALALPGSLGLPGMALLALPTVGPGPAYRYMAGPDGKIHEDGLQSLADLVKKAPGAAKQIPVSGMVDQRERARSLAAALSRGYQNGALDLLKWKDPPPKPPDPFGLDNLSTGVTRLPATPNDLYFLSLEYEKQTGRSLIQDLNARLDKRVKGEAIFTVRNQQTPEQRVAGLRNEDAVRSWMDKPAYREAMAGPQGFRNAPELKTRALKALDDFQAAGKALAELQTQPDGPAKAGRLAELQQQRDDAGREYVELRAMDSGLRYAREDLLKADDMKKAGKESIFNDAYAQMNTAPIKAQGAEAEQLYKKFLQASDPADRARLRGEFFQALAKGQEATENALSQEHYTNEDAIASMERTVTGIKTGAVVLAATVVAVGTGGTATPLIAGTLTGTSMGLILDIEDRALGGMQTDAQGQHIGTKDFVLGSLQNNFKTAFIASATAVGGKALAGLGGQLAADVARAGEGTWLAAAAAGKALQIGTIAAGNVVIDSVNRLANGQDLSAKRAAFAFFQGAVTAGIGTTSFATSGTTLGKIAEGALVTSTAVAGEAGYATFVEGHPPSREELLHNALLQVALFAGTARASKWQEAAQAANERNSSPPEDRPTPVIPSGDRPTPPVPSGDRATPPVPSGDRQTPPVPSGDRQTPVVPSGDRPTLPSGDRPTIPDSQGPATPRQDAIDTARPSDMPTKPPSQIDTARPSQQDTVRPSQQDTRPSQQDTVRPSQQDTMRPSQQDTVRPSRQDTVRPSQQDTVRPSQHDTLRPSQVDTVRPLQRDTVPAGHDGEPPTTQRSPGTDQDVPPTLRSPGNEAGPRERQTILPPPPDIQPARPAGPAPEAQARLQGIGNPAARQRVEADFNRQLGAVSGQAPRQRLLTLAEARENALQARDSELMNLLDLQIKHEYEALPKLKLVNDLGYSVAESDMDRVGAGAKAKRAVVDGVDGEVFMKVYRAGDDTGQPTPNGKVLNKRYAYAAREMEGARVLSTVRTPDGKPIGARFLGPVELGEGQIGLAFENLKARGADEPQFMGRMITEQTIVDARAKLKALYDAGYAIGDVQGMVTAEGEFLLIDPGGVFKATRPQDFEYMWESTERSLRHAMEKYRGEHFQPGKDVRYVPGPGHAPETVRVAGVGPDGSLALADKAGKPVATLTPQELHQMQASWESAVAPEVRNRLALIADRARRVDFAVRLQEVMEGVPPPGDPDPQPRLLALAEAHDRLMHAGGRDGDVARILELQIKHEYEAMAKRELKQDIGYAVSEGDNVRRGSGAAGKRAVIDGVDQPAFLKVYRKFAAGKPDPAAPASPDNYPYAVQEIQGARALASIKTPDGKPVAPRFYGPVEAGEGRIALAFEDLAARGADVPEAAPQAITEQAIADAKTKLKAIRDAGYVMSDINMMITPEGEVLFIDAGGVRKATGQPAAETARMQADVERRLRLLMDRYKKEHPAAK